MYHRNSQKRIKNAEKEKERPKQRCIYTNNKLNKTKRITAQIVFRVQLCLSLFFFLFYLKI